MNLLNKMICCALIAFLLGCGPSYRWDVHDMDRPQPAVVNPGDAIVLFDGNDLSQWLSDKGAPAQWKVADGYMEVNGTGSILTKQAFGDCQLHIEWASPSEISGSGQGRGNSGIFLMNTYELQVLDSYDNKTYPDGQTGAIYGQYPPLVNASRAPGQWQSYDIIFHRPVFSENGKLKTPARITVLHNGILIQDNTEILGATSHKKRAAYKPHPDKLPLALQDHGNPVRFRNIWIKEF